MSKEAKDREEMANDEYINSSKDLKEVIPDSKPDKLEKVNEFDGMDVPADDDIGKKKKKKNRSASEDVADEKLQSSRGRSKEKERASSLDDDDTMKTNRLKQAAPKVDTIPEGNENTSKQQKNTTANVIANPQNSTNPSLVPPLSSKSASIPTPSTLAVPSPKPTSTIVVPPALTSKPAPAPAPVPVSVPAATTSTVPLQSSKVANLPTQSSKAVPTEIPKLQKQSSVLVSESTPTPAEISSVTQEEIEEARLNKKNLKKKIAKWSKTFVAENNRDPSREEKEANGGLYEEYHKVFVCLNYVWMFL